MTELSHFGSRSVWRVDTEKCACILKSAGRWESDAGLTTQLLLLEHLTTRNLHLAPELIRTRDGSHFARMGEERWFVTQYVTGESPAWIKENFAKFGKTLAHSLRIDDELPHSVIHTDTSLHNAVLTRDGSLVLIDWENGGLGTTIIDIGHQLLLRFVNPAGELAIPEARAFYTAYFAVRPMAGYDARAIFDSGVMTALFFIGFGDAAVKWQRVTSAIRNRDIIMNYLVEWARLV